MTRADVRDMKRAVRKHGDGEAMICLLRRSIRFGHRRLALLRCLEAERMGVRIDAGSLLYCQSVADSLPPGELARILSHGQEAGGAIPSKRTMRGQSEGT
jgi:hypothetical protein